MQKVDWELRSHSVAISWEGSWTYQDGELHKTKLQGFFHAGRQAPWQGHLQCKAAQLQPEKGSHSEGAGQPQIQPPPSIKSRECLRLGFPSQEETAREPVAGPNSYHMTATRASLVARWPGTPLLTPLRCKSQYSSLHASLQNG